MLLYKILNIRKRTLKHIFHFVIVWLVYIAINLYPISKMLHCCTEIQPTASVSVSFLETCDNVDCGPGKRCKMNKKNKPRCVCAPDCSNVTWKGSVCGTDWKTYKDECVLLKARCKGHPELDVQYQGKCRSTCAIGMRSIVTTFRKKGDGSSLNNNNLLNSNAGSSSEPIFHTYLYLSMYVIHLSG